MTVNSNLPAVDARNHLTTGEFDAGLATCRQGMHECEIDYFVLRNCENFYFLSEKIKPFVEMKFCEPVLLARRYEQATVEQHSVGSVCDMVQVPVLQPAVRAGSSATMLSADAGAEINSDFLRELQC